MRSVLNHKHLTGLVGLVLAQMIASVALAEMVISDGSDGEFHPLGSQTIKLNDVAPDGVFNFTTIEIPSGVTITFQRNDLNTSVFFAATGHVVIEGTINVSAGGFGGPAGPGGGDGGAGSPNAAGSPGLGPSAGQGGPIPIDQGNAGGGGGMATPGLIATSRTGSNPAPGGPATNRPQLVPNQTGGGGSGGGGGGGRLFFGVDIPGGDGGGGGGGLQISTPGDLTISGSLISNGTHGGYAFANVFAHGGPGGGGSGGNIELYADWLTIAGSATVEAIGGAGGGLSTEPVAWDPYFYSSGVNGGEGYLFIGASHFSIDPEATINAMIVPEPSTLLLLAGGGLGLLLVTWRKLRFG